ncbi:phage tail tape measure protein [Dichotomicrobium thermohalophilum]|uniref:TP901 family phage tail tape measure protein n=1 Tax=Dichotomicrobium thermohalophilum TaxID=933063 RepID=A0A397P791_9HYPH|nr:phage tail tape measure protein [Dichotomicrobium thermohalophilum]RIA45410.1 TP901 family phage tail tape measure protein [Dichotomicrobium thermohalophilum]
MADLDVSVLVRLRDQFTQAARRIRSQLERIKRVGRDFNQSFRGGFRNMLGSVEQAGQQIRKQQQQLQHYQQSLTKWAIGAGAAIGIPTKFAVDFEDQMAQVRKVTDMSAADTRSFGRELMKMTRTLGVSHKQAAEMAFEAGRLGVRGREDIKDVVRLISKMVVALDLNAGESAKAMIRLKSIFKLRDWTEVRTVADWINHLDNTTIASAKDILKFFNRVGADAKELGFTAQQTATVGAAMLTMGEQARRAGLSLRMILTRLQTAHTTKKGANAITSLGYDARELAESLHENKFAGFLSFIKRLRGVTDPIARKEILVDILGLSQTSRINKIIGGFDVLLEKHDELERGVHLRGPGALTREYLIQLDKTSSDLTGAWNAIKETLVVLNQNLLSPLRAIARATRDAFGAITDFAKAHPEITGGLVKIGTALTAMAGLGIVMGLARAAAKLFMLKSAARIVGGAFSKLAGPAGGLSLFTRGLSKLAGLALSPMAWAITAIAAAIVVLRKPLAAFGGGLWSGFVEGLQPAIDSLKGLADTGVGRLFGRLSDGLGELLGIEWPEGWLGSFNSVGKAIGKFVGWLVGTPIKTVADAISGLADALGWLRENIDVVESLRGTWIGRNIFGLENPAKALGAVEKLKEQAKRAGDARQRTLPSGVVPGRGANTGTRAPRGPAADLPIVKPVKETNNHVTNVGGVSVSVSVNQTNASPQAIGNATASAVASEMKKKGNKQLADGVN